MQDVGMDKPEQRPEGKLLKDAVEKDPDLSVRKLAKLAGLSEGRVRQIINGAQPVGGGQYIEVVGNASTLARLAWHANLSGFALQEAGRPDAALELQKYYEEHPEERGDGIDWEAVRRWVESPYASRPPEELVSVFNDQELVREIGTRFRRYSQDVQELTERYVAQAAKAAARMKDGGTSDVDSDAAQKSELEERRARREQEVSDAPEIVEPAADDVDSDDDEEPGGSDEHV